MLNFYCVLICHIAVMFADKTVPKSLYDHFQQHEYKLNFERVELYRYTERFFNHLSVVTYKYNRTSPVTNFTFSHTVEVGNNMEVMIAQVYKFASNEYRLFPIRFQMNYCTALKANTAGLDRFFTCGNYTKCYIQKNHVYHVCNWAPNQYKFPPGIPTGNYMAEIQFLYFSEELLVLRGYGGISRPPPIPN